MPVILTAALLLVLLASADEQHSSADSIAKLDQPPADDDNPLLKQYFSKLRYLNSQDVTEDPNDPNTSVSTNLTIESHTNIWLDSNLDKRSADGASQFTPGVNRHDNLLDNSFPLPDIQNFATYSVQYNNKFLFPNPTGNISSYLDHPAGIQVDNFTTSQDQQFHASFLRESFHIISNIFTNVGLNCHMMPRDIERQIMEIIDYVSMNTEEDKDDNVNSKLWSGETHPINNFLKQFKSNARKLGPNCVPSKLFDKYFHRNIIQMINKMDADLIKHFMSRVVPLYHLFSSLHNNSEELNWSFRHICEKHLFLNSKESEHCFKTFKLLLSNDNESEYKNNTRRHKRYASETTVNKKDSLEERQVYGSKSQSYGGSSNFIIIPDDDYNQGHKYAHLTKLLSALAIGTYGILSLMTLKTYFLLAITGGPPGPGGDKGMLGPDGMKGVLGPAGDAGPAGVKGVKGDASTVNGDKGPTGPAGAIGAPGPPGEKGNKGTKGNPGASGIDGDLADPGATGDPGPAGPTGAKGPTGDPGKRKKRSLLQRQRRQTMELVDAPQVLNLLYQIKQNEEGKSLKQDFHSNDIVDHLNQLWRESKSTDGCVNCLLFLLLNNVPLDNLHAYIVAGFAQTLNQSKSLKLLRDVRTGLKSGTTMTCRRRKDTCTVEHLM